MIRRALLLALAAMAVAALVTSTGALSSARLDRNVTVRVADDQHALLGVEATDVTVTGDASDVALLTLVNRDTDPLTTVSVSVSEADATGPPTLSNVTAIGSLEPGESGTVRADVACGSGANSERLDFGIAASRQGLEVRLDRSVELDCT